MPLQRRRLSPAQSNSRGRLQVTEVQVAADGDTDSGASKRSLTVVNVDPQIDPTNSKRSLEARKYAFKTDHCGVNGGQWMPLVAVKPTDNGVNDAIASFCNHFDGTVIPGGSVVSALVQSTGGENLILTDGSIGHFKGTIYVRPNHQVTVSAALCTTYMQAVGNPGSQCYGSKNKDTYGGRNDLDDSYYDVVPLPGAGT